MNCPIESFRYAHFDKYSRHRVVSQKFANYITRSPVLNRRSSRHPNLSPDPAEVPLDLYIARVIHAAKVPDVVPYVALYILCSITQTCQCKVPHDANNLSSELSCPAKLSHIVSQAMARTRFSRVVKSRWNERHFFIGAFYLAILAYKPVFWEEHQKELPYWNMIHVSGIEEEEIEEVAAAFEQCVTYEVRMAMDLMLYDKFVIKVAEFECPFASDRQGRLTKDEDKDEHENEEGQKKCSKRLKKSISTFWKPKGKATPVESPEPEWNPEPESSPEPEPSVDCGSDTPSTGSGSASSCFYF